MLEKFEVWSLKSLKKELEADIIEYYKLKL